jgi:hypothetical protein
MFDSLSGVQLLEMVLGSDIDNDCDKVEPL